MSEVNESGDPDQRRIVPEKCETSEAFDKAIEKRADELRERFRNDPDARDYAKSLVFDQSTEKILEMKKNAAERCEEAAVAYKEACFGKQEELPDDKRADRSAESRDAWEDSVKDVCLYDMALEQKRAGQFKSAFAMALTAFAIGQGQGEEFVNRENLQPDSIDELASSLSDATGLEEGKNRIEGESLSETDGAEVVVGDVNPPDDFKNYLNGILPEGMSVSFPEGC